MKTAPAPLKILPKKGRLRLFPAATVEPSVHFHKEDKLTHSNLYGSYGKVNISKHSL